MLSKCKKKKEKLYSLLILLCHLFCVIPAINRLLLKYFEHDNVKIAI